MDDQDASATTAHDIEHMLEEPPLPIQTEESDRPAQTVARKVHSVPFSHKNRPRGARQTVAVVLVPVLAAVLLLLVRKPLKGPSAASAAAPSAPAMVAQAANDIDIDWQVPPLYPGSERDPMRLKPPAPQEEELPATREPTRENIVVKGVLYSEDRSAAIVGTRLLHVGDKVSGATVVAIAEDGVEFEMNGQRWKEPVSDSD